MGEIRYRPDGGHAFPVPAPCTAIGMSLRDYFAGQFACSVMSSAARNHPSPDDMAKACYLMADAMLRERAKT